MFFIFINNFFEVKKCFLDITGHNILDFTFMLLFTSNFEFYTVLLATKKIFYFIFKKLKEIFKNN